MLAYLAYASHTGASADPDDEQFLSCLLCFIHDCFTSTMLNNLQCPWVLNEHMQRYACICFSFTPACMRQIYPCFSALRSSQLHYPRHTLACMIHTRAAAFQVMLTLQKQTHRSLHRLSSFGTWTTTKCAASAATSSYSAISAPGICENNFLRFLFLV